MKILGTIPSKCVLSVLWPKKIKPLFSIKFESQLSPTFLSPIAPDPVSLKVDELEWETLLKRLDYHQNALRISDKIVTNYRTQERRSLGLPDHSISVGSEP